MIKEHRVFQLVTKSGDNIDVEVNWSNHKDIKDCKLVKLKVGGQELIVEREKLTSLMLLIGSIDDQKKLLPMKMTNIKKLERMLTFDWTASKDYRKGDKITVKAPWIDQVPITEEVFAGNVSAKKKNPFNFFVK